MNTKYSDLINQTYYFPQDEFTLNKDNLKFHNIDLMKLWKNMVPIKITYLPQISNNINKAKIGFVNRWKNKYEAKYYCYCTKSSI
jgi:arginine decarboxylase